MTKKEMNIFKCVDKYGTIYYENENGDFHREDGPAFEYSDGSVEYYLKGKKYTKEDWELKIVNMKLKRIKDL